MGPDTVVVGQPRISSLMPQSVPPAGTGGYVRALVGPRELGAAVDVPQAESNAAMIARAHERRIDAHCLTSDQAAPYHTGKVTNRGTW